MSLHDAENARKELLATRRALAADIEHHASPTPEQLAQLLELDRRIGATLGRSMFHDAGAYARCSWCQRYSADPNSIIGVHTPAATAPVVRCDCGRHDGWSGSFLPPGPAAIWSTGLKNFPGEMT